MQAVTTNQTNQATAVQPSVAATGPAPIAPELLSLIGGGKVALTPQAQLPVNKW